MEDINDATNITGMSKLLNKSNTDAGLNVELIERDMIGKAGVKLTRNVNPDKEYQETMKELADMAGIPIADMDMGSDSGSYSGSFESSYDSDEYESGEDDSEEYTDDDENDEQFIEKLKKHETTDSRHMLKAPKLDMGGRDRRHGNNVFGRTNVADPSRHHRSQRQEYASQPQYPPQQHYQQPPQGGNAQFDQVLQGYGGPVINVDKENEEENKTMMLEDIDELWAELQDDDVDLSRIPKVNQDSPLDDVAQVQKILRMKYDRRRYTTFGTEFILAGVHGLEYLFDGKRKWGPYQPDLTNWHNTVRTKLRRMRYETSMIVADAMSTWNVGAFTRVMIELVPSAFLHSRMRSEQHGKAGYSPDQMSETYDALRAYDKE